MEIIDIYKSILCILDYEQLIYNNINKIYYSPVSSEIVLIGRSFLNYQRALSDIKSGQIIAYSKDNIKFKKAGYTDISSQIQKINKLKLFL